MRRGSLLVASLALAVAAATARTDQGPVITTLTLFAGTAQGLWRSTNWGHDWEAVQGRSSGVHLDSAGPARVVRPLGAQVWLGTDAGLYASADFGETWNVLSATPDVRSLLVSRWPQIDATVFVGTGSGLLRSRDGGRTLAPTALSGTAVRRMEWPGPALVVACDRGLMVSLDEGEHFAGPGEGLPEGPVVAMALSSFFAVDPVLFVAAQGGGVFRSADRGVTWNPAGLAGERVFDLVWLGPFLYAAGEAGFYRTQDLGVTWLRLSPSPGRPTRLMFPLAPAAGIEAFLATDRGIFHTLDGGEHWQGAGLAGQEVLEIATFPQAPPATEKRPRR